MSTTLPNQMIAEVGLVGFGTKEQVMIGFEMAAQTEMFRWHVL
jgi:hypothetical protein